MVEIDNSKSKENLNSYFFVSCDIGLWSYERIDDSVYDYDLIYGFDKYFIFACLMGVFTALLDDGTANVLIASTFCPFEKCVHVITSNARTEGRTPGW